MTKLLIFNPQKLESLNTTSFAGLPVQQVGSPLKWPICQTCESEMQYQGKIKTDAGLELIFMCNNDPGMCDEWDANGGGNKVMLVEGLQLEPFYPTEGELSIRDASEYSTDIIEIATEEYYEAKESWGGENEMVLGQLYGEPSWLQSDETPTCDTCHQPMRFVAQLEEGPSSIEFMNFGGGGIGYLFDCVEHKSAKFLWQC